MAVKAIPDGYHTVTAHLIIRDTAKALDFYKKAFGAEETVRMPGPGGKIMHAEMRIGNSVVMMGEESLECGSKSPQTLGGAPVSFYIYTENVDAAWKRAIDAGCKVKMPLADMFWGDRAGWMTDPFGHDWGVAQHTRDLTPEQIKKGQEEMMKQMQKK